MSEDEIYKQMYYKLFNNVSDAISELRKGNVLQAHDILMKAQQTTEEMYISQE